MTDQDTAELVRRAAAGDELAWRQLIDGLGPLLRRVSSAYRLGEAEAADAVGDRVQTSAARSRYHPRFVPVQDTQRRRGARSDGQGLRWRLGGASQHQIRVPPLAIRLMPAPLWSQWLIRTFARCPGRRDVRPGDSPTKATRSTGH
jgi:hypothetical protein